MVAAAVEVEAMDELLRQVAARALGEDGVAPAQLHAAGERILRLAVAADAEVAGRDADDAALAVDQHLGGRKPRIDLDPELLGLAPEVAADVAERADEVAVVRHQPRHRPLRHAQASGGGEVEELVARDLGPQGALRVLAPAGHEPGEA